MKADQYRKIAEHPLRVLYRNMVQDDRDVPYADEVKAAIEEALPGADEKIKAAVFTDLKRLAKAAQVRGRGDWFDLKAQADLKVLELVEGLEAMNRMVPVAEDDIDAAALADQVMEPNDVEKALHAITSRLPDSERSW